MMSETAFTAFLGSSVLATGPIEVVAAAARAAISAHPDGTVLIFADATGKVIDLPVEADTSRGARGTGTEPRSRGRPKLGVVAREVTLLPQHWEWLAAQPGGASVTLRRLVHAARSAGRDSSARNAAAYSFMVAVAGDLPGFEEAARALFAGRYDALERKTSAWPRDVRAYALRLARGAPLSQS